MVLGPCHICVRLMSVSSRAKGARTTSEGLPFSRIRYEITDPGSKCHWWQRSVEPVSHPHVESNVGCCLSSSGLVDTASSSTTPNMPFPMRAMVHGPCSMFHVPCSVLRAPCSVPAESRIQISFSRDALTPIYSMPMPPCLNPAPRPPGCSSECLRPVHPRPARPPSPRHSWRSASRPRCQT